MSTLNHFVRYRDEPSFRALYRQHTPMIFAMAVRLSGSRNEAEELVQEAWVRAVERIESFGRRSKFGTWLAGILVNCHRESMRRDVRSQPASAEVIEAFGHSEIPRADPADLEKAIGSLAAGYREVVVLHDLYGYTHQEISELLGIEPGTSKSQLARGRARLRRALTEKAPHARGNGSGN
ncbi:MAG: RNA polymerase sigma factor [Xanthomonadales bacterium]|nr:RNA polymerase sigma factor [Xanthomonadales bacterium]